MKFKGSPLAHKYCIGKGIEIGPAAHNPFNLLDCLNLAPLGYFDFYKDYQITMCGSYAEVDIVGTANNISAADESLNYIIHSHVMEHIPNLIDAFYEWDRVLKPNGIIFIIVPKRDSLESDRKKNISTIDEIEDANISENNMIMDEGGHVWVFSLASLIDLVRYLKKIYGLDYEILEALETDDKVGNGHCIILKKER